MISDALKAGAVAGVGLLSLLLIVAAVLFKLALVVVVIGGAWLILEHFGVLMLAPLALA